MNSLTFMQSLLNNEMAIHLKATEVLSNSMNDYEAIQSASDSSSSDKEELLYLTLLKQAMLANTDQELVSLTVAAYRDIMRVVRPYQAHLRSDSGSNRIRSMNDVQQKFGIDSSVVLKFTILQLQMMIDTLNIPEHFIFCGHRSNGIEALTVSLHRLACPIRFADLSIIYDLLPSHLSQIFAGFMLWIYDTFGDLVRSFQNPWTTERHWLE